MDETTTNPNAERDVNAIKNDIQKLRDDLTVLVGHFISYSKEKLADARGRFGAAAEAFRGRASGRVQETKESVHRQGHQAVQTSRAAIRQKPLTYAAAAFCTGMFFSATYRHGRA